jgi:MFS family permease
MTTYVQPPVRDTRAGSVVAALVQTGIVSPIRQNEAITIVDGVLADRPAAAAPLRNRLAELAGYVGGALVVSAAGIFVTAQWASLSHGEQIGLLIGSTVLLAVAAGALVVIRGGRAALREAQEAVRRRLAGLLFTAAAGTASAAAGLQAEHVLDSHDSAAALVASLAFLLLSTVGYLIAPTVVGQLGIAGGAFMTVPWALDEFGNISPIPFGLSVVVIGVAWLVLAERGSWRETASARVIGSTLAVVGAQIPVFTSDYPWVAYVTTATIALAAFGTFMVRPAWPYLAAGVIGVTLAVPEAVLDWTGGTVGAAGVLLVTGATLLAAALLSLRLRREVKQAAAPSGPRSLTDADTQGGAAQNGTAPPFS